MICLLRYLSLVFSFAFGIVFAAISAEPRPPAIVAQGFDISVAQEGILGEFGQVRVRFEAPERIAELYIKERSYEVDLATTPETSHLPLFGINSQVRQLTDVTLDFQGYLNRKIEAEGVFNFELRVTDRKGKSVTGNLAVRAFTSPSAAAQSASNDVKVGSFRFERAGSSAVSGADNFGITWTTIDAGDVLIEIYPAQGSSSSLFEASAADYDEVSTRNQLEQKASTSGAIENVLLPTAGGEAAGSVFGIISGGQPYLLRVTESETFVTELGTRVILVGEYKH